MSTFTLPSGRVLKNIHSPAKCFGRPCTIHNPTAHHMRDWHLHWRDDRKIFERICEHGVGHPDLDQREYLASRNDNFTHGCCWEACCIAPAK